MITALQILFVMAKETLLHFSTSNEFKLFLLLLFLTTQYNFHAKKLLRT